MTMNVVCPPSSAPHAGETFAPMFLSSPNLTSRFSARFFLPAAPRAIMVRLILPILLRVPFELRRTPAVKYFFHRKRCMRDAARLDALAALLHFDLAIAATDGFGSDYDNFLVDIQQPVA